MRKLFAMLVILAVALSACAYSQDSSDDVFERGYSAGYDAGYDDGKWDMYDDLPDIDDILYDVADAAADWAAEQTGMEVDEAYWNIEQYQHPDPSEDPVSWQDYMDSIETLQYYYDYFCGQVYWNEFDYMDW